MRIRVYVGVALGALLLVPMGAYGMVNLGNNEGLTGSVGGGIDSYNIKGQQLEVLMQRLNALQVQQRALVQSQVGQTASATGSLSAAPVMNDGSAGAVQSSPTIGATVQNAGVVQNVRATQNYQAAVQQLNQLRMQLEALQTMQRGMTTAPSGNTPSGAYSVSANGSIVNDLTPVTDECGVIPVLRQGGVGSDVSLLQKALIGSGNLRQGLDTGFYGSLTAAAVKAFQSRNGLPATGVVDAQTADVLNFMLPGIQRCIPVRMGKGYIGTLQAATGTPVWGTHVLFADGFVFNQRGGAYKIGKNYPTTYLVKAANDSVLAKLKGLEGKRVMVTGNLVHIGISRTNLWGLVAQDVVLSTSTPGQLPGSGGGSGVSGGGSGFGSGSGLGSGSGSGSGTPEGGSASTTLVINGSTYLPTALVGTPYSATISVTGGSGQYQWTFISGDASNRLGNSFPAGSGLSMSGGNGATVTISGTPTSSDSGKEYFFALRVDSGSEYAIKNFILYVSPATSNGSGTAVSVVLVTPPNWQEQGMVGQPYSTTFLAANEPEGTYQWSITEGSLPPGLSLSGGTNSQTTVAGTPTLAGSYNFTLRVSSTYGGSMQNQYNITILPATTTSSTPMSVNGGFGTQGGTSDASGQESMLMASILESMKGVLQQILGSLVR